MSSVYFSSSTSAVDKDDGTVNIAVTCSPAAPAGGCSVHYATEDVTANSTTYGMGKNYTSTSGTLSFSEGETSKNITVTIINNSLFFPDITFTVTLSSPVNCTLGGTTENICTIQDSLAPFVLTVDDSDGSLTDIDHASWACAGDGVTDDRANFQNILDYLKANGGGVAHIPSGLTILIGTYTQVADYFIGMWMPCRQQITISGEGSSNSIILAGIKSGLTQYHLLECGRQYGRGSPSTDYWYGADIGDDSPGLCFLNVRLDGNGPNQDYWGTWDREYCMLLDPSAYAGASFENAGRLKVFMQGCDFRNSLSGGIDVCENSDIVFYKCTSLNCTRGSVELIGGYSKIDIRDCDFDSDGNCKMPVGGWPGHVYDNGLPHDMGLHQEVMDGQQGYGGRWDVDLTVNNVTVKAPCYLQDVNFSPVYPSTWTFNNMVQSGRGGWRFEPWQQSGTGTVLEATDCSFLKRMLTAADMDKTGYIDSAGGTFTFTRCTFDLGTNVPDNTWTADWGDYLWWGTSATFSLNNYIPTTLTLEDCTFTVTDPTYEVQYSVPALYLEPASMGGSATPPVINLINPIFTGEHARNFYAQNIAGTVNITGGTHPQPNGYGSTPARFQFTSGTYNLSVSFHDLLAANLGSGGYFIVLSGNVYGSGKTVSFDFSDNVNVPQSLNTIQFYQDHSPPHEGYTLIGGRLVWASDINVPTENTDGFVDDLYILTNNNSYICTSISYENHSGAWEYYGVWTPPNENVYSRGAYSSLPANDTDLDTLYSVDDVADIATDDTDMVAQLATSQIAIHQFKQEINGVGGIINIVAQVTIPCSTSTAYLQIYNRSGTPAWDTIDSDNATGANTDFTLSASVADLTDYKDENNIVACRVYQEMQ